MSTPLGTTSPHGELFRRDPANPILTANDWPYQINTVFNPGATSHDGETVLLCRVEDRRGLSHLTVARSPDGVHGWRVDAKPLLADDPSDQTSMWGVEDCRITYVAELSAYVISYTAYGPAGPCVALATTEDFQSVEKLGVVMPPEDKNASLLPRRVNGEFCLYHRPLSVRDGRADVWMSRSKDLRQWSNPEPVMTSRQGAWWDAARMGLGPAPIETEHGWLGVYHGVKEMAAGPLYRAGLVLFDLDNPAKVIRRSPQWVLGPSADYETHGDVPNVVFPTGMIHDEETGDLRLYYGAGDSCIAMATASMSEALDYLLQYG
ncbi:glycosidase [Catenulispora pinisilvae]|uniref:glycoside hydrolase family 130 protein n=1 Tax=Catenulispora pinisilvae TaxID=2705253 RepID=UPI001891342E|nr:glycosidase [Catenulispora pinisilvae]